MLATLGRKEGGKGTEPGPKPRLAPSQQVTTLGLASPSRKGAGSGRLPTQSSTVQCVL